ncbi:hypothetical protein SAMN05518668_10769 [Sphingobium sp. YR657]|uniref:Uncharacterized protein n=2 Tax=Sphingomonadaceae TaxID=41297 RepID=K9DCP7_SPHYA|nr:hypothetical protein HMPREF9718_00378 [Sphingobium yanoikuyae ATCC 51230]SHM25564.1 hypothetical protein SAMN05518668_10769 [Sphingobium sp. YR657]
MGNRWGLAAAQLATVAFLMMAGVLAPPARGDMLAIPLTTASGHGLAAGLIAVGAIPIGKGQIEGALVVRGDRDRLGWPMLARGVLLLAAPDFLCAGRGGRA